MKKKVTLLLAALCFAASGGSAWRNMQEEETSIETSAAVLKVLKQDVPPQPLAPIDAGQEMSTVAVDDTLYIGEVAIPSLQLDLPVQSTATDASLKKSPGRFYGSVYEDNLVIAGHGYLRQFGRIKSLPIGSEITFTDMDGNVFHYVVSWFETLSPDQGEEMCTGDWDLTLYTCTIDNTARVAVRCERVDSMA